MSLTKVSYSLITGAPYNVLDYGADNTGATNTTLAIQAAINAAEADGGGTVYVPPGDYLIGVVNLKNNVNIVGSGEASKFITSDPTTGAFRGTSVGNIDISHIFIQGTNIVDPNDPQNGDTGIYLGNCTNVKIHHCKVDGVFAWGLIATNSNSRKIEFSHNTITNIGNQSALACDNGVEDFIIANNFVVDCKLYGVEVENESKRGIVTGNYIEDCVAGVGLQFDVSEIICSNNIIYNNNNVNSISSASGYGIYINGEVSGTRFPQRISILGNQIKNHNAYPILISGRANEFVISQNFIVKGSASIAAVVVALVNGAKTHFTYTDNLADCSNNSIFFSCENMNGLEFKNNSVYNVSTQLLDFGGSVSNSRIEIPRVAANEIATLSGVEALPLGFTNYVYSHEYPEYTSLTGTTTNRYLTARRNQKLIGVQWCISPTSVGGGVNDYWVVNLDSVDVAPNFTATTANLDNWSYTPLNTQKTAGNVIDFQILNGAGTTYNYNRYRLIVI